MNLLPDLFITFARVGVCTFGGGYAMLPVLQREVVSKKEWITDEELADCYAIGQCTPGVIAVNAATYVGYKKKGGLGGILATLGVVFPSVLIIGLIAAFLQQFAYLPWAAHAFAGIRACVCALIFTSVLRLLKTAVIDIPAAALYCAALLASARFGLPPVLVVVTGGAVGLAVSRIRGWRT